MKCQKCARPAMVHLTEILTKQDMSGDAKRAVEIHLCLAHAVEAGLLAPGAEQPGGSAAAQASSGAAASNSSSIVPATPKAKSVAVAPPAPAHPSELVACPVCGMSWSQFKSGGVMGCTHDYEMFQSKLLPLLKRAQEGATEHAGKVPASRRRPDVDRRRVTVRLQRELQRAVNAENYESAAKLRDQLKSLGHT